tara:strand:- start:178 stop:366 length:189 start_codon:yes stop_codon:yes gene_type:complete
MAKSSKKGKKIKPFDEQKTNLAMGKPANMPGYVYDSIKRQYSGKDYTIEDKKNVINWYKKKA